MTDLLPIVKSAQEIVTDTPVSKAISYTLSDVWNAIVGDSVSAWRMRRVIPIQKAVEKQASENGVKIAFDKLPEHYALRWFEASTQSEESDEITEIFARLLVESCGGNKDALRTILLEKVASFSAADAIIFGAFIRNLIRKFDEEAPDMGITIVPGVAEGTGPQIDSVQMLVSLDALASLGLLKIGSVQVLAFDTGGSFPYMAVVYSLGGPANVGFRRDISLTWLGLALANAIFPELNPNRLASIRSS